MKKEMIVGYKCCRADGTDFYSGTVDYAAYLKSGKPIVVTDPDGPMPDVCGRGIHFCDTPRKTVQFRDYNYRPYRWFQLEIDPSHVIQTDEKKGRASRVEKVVKELSLEDVLGNDIKQRINAVKTDIESWKDIPWGRPARDVKPTELRSLFKKWHTAITMWTKGKMLPLKFRVVNAGADAADAAADAAVYAAAADAYLDWRRWYVRPSCVLRRSAWWKIAGMKKPNPWEPLIAMYRLGAIPIGYSRGVFAVYMPKPAREN